MSETVDRMLMNCSKLIELTMCKLKIYNKLFNFVKKYTIISLE